MEVRLMKRSAHFKNMRVKVAVVVLIGLVAVLWPLLQGSNSKPVLTPDSPPQPPVQAQNPKAGVPLVVSASVTPKTDPATPEIHHPIAAPLENRYRQGLKVRATALADDPELLSAVDSLLARGATVTTQEGWVIYSPPVAPGTPGSLGLADASAKPGTTEPSVATSPAASAISTRPLARVRGNGVPGQSYTIEFAEDTTATVWHPLGTARADAFGAYEYLDHSPGETTKRVYRARTQQ
jgi:hypothetical protein